MTESAGRARLIAFIQEVHAEATRLRRVYKNQTSATALQEAFERLAAEALAGQEEAPQPIQRHWEALICTCMVATGNEVSVNATCPFHSPAPRETREEPR
jgi:hypothetical protein